LFGKLQDRRFINNLYDRAAIFCLPSLSESFGIVMIEAASRGCYLITSELTAALDITNNWTMGSKIRPGNFEDLLDVLKISTSPEKFGEILNDGEKLSNYFKSNYSPEVVIPRLYNNLFLNTE
jgi:glycosyltransferase involved in cell wall biosynthesis